MKVSITLDDKLMERIDDYADRNYMSRSGLISLATTNFLNQADVVQAIKSMALTMQKIADRGQIDHETMQELEDFHRFCNLFNNA